MGEKRLAEDDLIIEFEVMRIKTYLMLLLVQSEKKGGDLRKSIVDYINNDLKIKE